MDFTYETMEYYIILLDQKIEEVWRGCEASKEKERYPWIPYDLTRTKKIWADFIQSGIVKDEKGLDKMADNFLNKIVTIKAMTILSGHTEHSPKDVIEDLELTWSEETDEKIGDYIFDDEQGQWRISDFAMDQWEELACKIIEADTPVNKLIYLDMVLNVVHQRSDIAAWFIKGGRNSLDELSNQNI